eukprot:831596-Amorphochlora_amoeboformis.AAC.1
MPKGPFQASKPLEISNGNGLNLEAVLRVYVDVSNVFAAGWTRLYVLWYLERSIDSEALDLRESREWVYLLYLASWT